MPRHIYWTIVMADGPTAFRAREREDLLPTLRQLQARHPEALMKWFERGQLWDSPEAARIRPPRRAAPQRRPTSAPVNKWRDGGVKAAPGFRGRGGRPPGRADAGRAKPGNRASGRGRGPK